MSDITRYRGRKNFKLPLATENIIMVCFLTHVARFILVLVSFTMAIVHPRAPSSVSGCEFKRVSKSITMRGRPKAGPIQAIGGVKGAESFGFKDIYNDAQRAIDQGTAEQAAVLSKISQLPIHQTRAELIEGQHLASEFERRIPCSICR